MDSDTNGGATSNDIAALSRPDTTVLVTRGVIRLFRAMGDTCLTEFRLKNGRRVDVAALSKNGTFTAIEVKSSIEDFRVDMKWRDYLPFCDRFFFAVPLDFPLEMLPDDTGLILADAYDAAIERPATEGDMNASRRKALMIRYARQATDRLHAAEKLLTP